MEVTLDRTSTLKVGDKAPEFTLKDQNGNPVSLSDYVGKKNVVIVFHPLAFTSVCDVQMPGYNQERQSFNGLNTQVFAISVDSVPTHRAWAERLGGIDYPMLADFWPHGEVARRYGAAGVIIVQGPPRRPQRVPSGPTNGARSCNGSPGKQDLMPASGSHWTVHAWLHMG